MAYSTENLNEVKALLAQRRSKAEADAQKRLFEIHAISPEIKEIDACFPKIGAQIIGLFADKSSAEEKQKKIDALHRESDELKAARKACLEALGYSIDYTAPRYTCTKCNDTGYLEFKICDCMKKELTLLGFKNSGLGALLDKQSFENFSLEYYNGSDKETMQANLEICKGYADTFSEKSGSILMIGGTGLGKTHLSTSIAATVIKKGFNVQYVTAQNLIDDFIFERYHRSFTDDSPNRTDKYFECDLLIIDDFGTEENNQFSVSSFYNLINSRYNNEKPTIINTNVRQNAIVERYTERIASRLFGEYTVLAFPGKDVRMQKLMK